ncbi:MAG TPA: hypothetical protein VGP63_12615 [Planctomycetaceae bacterium]|jgi:hypothetical protein|nr:hypothetical protein [Planctomycetaceae bacterium]
MGVLQDELNRLIEKQCSDNSAKVELLRLILVKKGLSLSQSELESIVHKIEDNEGF